MFFVVGNEEDGIGSRGYSDSHALREVATFIGIIRVLAPPPPSLPLRRAGSSSILLVEGSTAAPANSEVVAVGVV